MTLLYTILDQACSQTVRTVNGAVVQAYYAIGQSILKDEQAGAGKADYGKRMIPELAKQLTQSHVRGFSATHLKLSLQFYLRYRQFGHTASDQSRSLKQVTRPH